MLDYAKKYQSDFQETWTKEEELVKVWSVSDLQIYSTDSDSLSVMLQDPAFGHGRGLDFPHALQVVLVPFCLGFKQTTH